MRKKDMPRNFVCLAALAIAFSPFAATAQESATSDETGPDQKRTVEPVFRVSKLNNASEPTVPRRPSESNSESVGNNVEPVIPKVAANPSAKPPHPLDRAIQLAKDGLVHMRENVDDYTAVLVKRECVNNKIGDKSYMAIKIRNARESESVNVPFSIYMRFLKPRAQAGREVIWVDGQNGNRICAHEAGLMSFKRFNLDPNGWLAMQNNKYPIYEAGLENLIVKLIEKAERDRSAGNCITKYNTNASIKGRPCTLIEVMHPVQKAPYEFYKAHVFIDQELNVPVRYAAYDWPVGNQPPALLEEYTYINVKLNVGLSDKDFSPENPEYRFPK